MQFIRCMCTAGLSQPFWEEWFPQRFMIVLWDSMVYQSVRDVNVLQLPRNLIFQPQRHADTFCCFPLTQVELGVVPGAFSFSNEILIRQKKRCLYEAVFGLW